MKHLIFALLLFCPFAQANTEAPKNLGHIPVAYEGRMMEAQALARMITNTPHIDTTNPTEWLFQTLFNPEKMAHTPFIRVKEPALLATLNLPHRKEATYTPAELTRAYVHNVSALERITDKTQQAQLAALQNTLNTFNDLTQTLTPFFSFSSLTWADIPDAFMAKHTSTPPRYIDFLKYKHQIKQQAALAVQTYGSDITQYATDTQKIAYLSFALDTLTSQGKASTLFSVIPTADHLKTGHTLTPWQSILQGEGTPQRAEIFDIMARAVQAHQEGEQAELKQQLDALNTALYQTPHTHLLRMKIETIYHAITPLHLLIVLSSLSALLSLLCYKREDALFEGIRKWTFSLLTVLLAADLLCRSLILWRPPVGTLFESILFVSFICMLITPIAGWHKDKRLNLLAILLLVVMLQLAQALNQTQSSMPLLTAVLNTQFWLTVHVLCITAGYAISVLTALIAHIALIHKKATLSQVRKFAVWATFFTLVGTLLGGVWADQSWGRFWGWDPKENGALLLVLWLAWCLHIPYSLKVSRPMQYALFAATNLVVALSWFGVNLLGVGLHSYGFTEGVMAGLVAFFFIQTLLIIYLYKKAKP